MLRLGVTQEWVDEGELARERTKNQRWQRLYEVLAEATHGEVVVRRQVFGVYASKLASDESLGHQHMGAMYHRGRSQIASTSESHGGDLIIQRYYQSGWRVGLLQYSHSLKGARQVKGQGRRRDFCGVIDPLLLWGESISHKRDQGGGKCRGKLQVPRQDGRAEAKELHKTDVAGLLIKIAESEGLWVDAGVLDQGTK
ncbi:hypothetical protein BHM03_00053587 [Ensete ventricosum]|nr:hypothetical protein BHM03_00053587 [Ensete ventricosum]